MDERELKNSQSDSSTPIPIPAMLSYSKPPALRPLIGPGIGNIIKAVFLTGLTALWLVSASFIFWSERLTAGQFAFRLILFIVVAIILIYLTVMLFVDAIIWLRGSPPPRGAWYTVWDYFERHRRR